MKLSEDPNIPEKQLRVKALRACVDELKRDFNIPIAGIIRTAATPEISERRLMKIIHTETYDVTPAEADAIYQLRAQFEQYGVPLEARHKSHKGFPYDRENLRQLISALKERFNISLKNIENQAQLKDFRLRSLLHSKKCINITTQEATSLCTLWEKLEEEEE